jgi:PucR C-terminal helix-turn-helix domain/GAF domain
MLCFMSILSTIGGILSIYVGPTSERSACMLPSAMGLTVPGNILSITANILEKAIQGATGSEMAETLAALRDASPADDARDIERLTHLLTEVADKIGESHVAERGINLLIDTTHDLSSTLGLQELLRTIVARARSLVGANLAWLTLLDEEHGILRTVTAEGHLSPVTSAMSTEVGYGAVSLIVSSKSFFATQDYLGDRRFRHSAALDRIFRGENIVSLAGFPILSQGKLQGILFVADRYIRKLTGREISVLGSFALHAGVAMRNAQAFTMLSETLAEAERNRLALIDHIHRVDASATAHDEMTSLLAKGAEWPLFVQRMANQIDGSIILYDDSLSPREHFASATYKGTLAAAFKDEKIDPTLLIPAMSQSRESGRSVVVLEIGDEHCRAMTLHGGAGHGESLVICYRGELDPIDVRNLERSTVALSIAKLWNEKRETDKLMASSTLLRHLVLVTPPDVSTLSAIRDRLDLNMDQPVMLALIALSGLDRALQTASVRASAARLNVLVDLVDDAYLAIGPEKSVRALLQNLLRRGKAGETGGILSDPFSDLTGASACYRRMVQALRILLKMKRLDRFVEQSQINLFAKLFEVGDAERIARYVEQVLAPIEERDPRNRSKLKQTLLCYFDSEHNIARTAERLSVHSNTVRQRLDTLREITGGWEDPITALEMHVALRLDSISADA